MNNETENDDDDGGDIPLPWSVLEPVVSWMVSAGVGELRVVAGTIPPLVSDQPSREESPSLLFCDEAPDAPGLTDIYVVTDEDGRGCLNGPSPVPQSVLRPLLIALSSASVSELRIAAHSGEEPADRCAKTSQGADTEEFEEHELPAVNDWPPVLIAVQQVPGLRA